jgi:hypothetical protein
MGSTCALHADWQLGKKEYFFKHKFEATLIVFTYEEQHARNCHQN